MKQTIYKSMRYIKENIEEPLTLEEIAKHFGYSKFHFSRMFKTSVGISLKEYLIETKLNQAAKDILNGSSITHAAIKYQYDTHAGFGKAFRKKFGYPPQMLHVLRYTRFILLDKGGLVMDTKKLYQELMDGLNREQVEEGKALIEKAFDFAQNAHQNQYRYSGEPYVTFPLNVAIILASMEVSAHTIALGLLSECKDNVELESIFGRQMYDDLIQISNLDLAETLLSQEISKPIENAIFVKLASRLYNMKTLKYMNEDRWKEKAKETLEIFSPLAEKLNLMAFKIELDQLAVQYLS